MPTLYLIRHGETEYNRQLIVQGGGIDAELNETGRQQGLQFFEQYKTVPFDLVCCTGLQRTFQTIENFEAIGHEVFRFSELNELNYGVLEGAKASPAVRAEFERINAVWGSGDLAASVDQGESPLQAWSRVEAALNRIRRMLPENGKALICIHGRIMRILLSQMLGYGMQYMHLFPHHNTALNLLQWFPSGTVRLEKLNDISHLNPE